MHIWIFERDSKAGVILDPLGTIHKPREYLEGRGGSYQKTMKSNGGGWGVRKKKCHVVYGQSLNEQCVIFLLFVLLRLL